MPLRLLLTTLCLALGAVTLNACGTDSARADERLQVAAALYPLQFAAEQIGGAHVDVTNLTKPGAEPHDLELSPADLVTVAKADLVLHHEGLQPAVDEAVAPKADRARLDVSGAARLHDDRTESADPHFWLDPLRYAEVGGAIATRLSAIDPTHEADFEAAADRFATRLTALDGELRTTLARCASRHLVTSHASFGYLAGAYGLHQVGIAGLSPDAEPDPAVIAEITRFVRDHGVRTVYAETLASQSVTETVARETGARLAVLDPVEGLSEGSAGDDYFAVMRANLATLKAGQGCT